MVNIRLCYVNHFSSLFLCLSLSLSPPFLSYQIVNSSSNKKCEAHQGTILYTPQHSENALVIGTIKYFIPRQPNLDAHAIFLLFLFCFIIHSLYKCVTIFFPLDSFYSYLIFHGPFSASFHSVIHVCWIHQPIQGRDGISHFNF